MKKLMILALLLTSFTAMAESRTLPLNWKNPVKCTVTNFKSTAKTIMDVDIDDPKGMDEISKFHHTQLELKLQKSEFGQGRKSLNGETTVQLDKNHEVFLSVVIDPSMGKVSEGDAMLVNAFLIDKSDNSIIGNTLSNSNEFNDNFDGTLLLATSGLIYNNIILSKIHSKKDASIAGRLSSNRVNKEMVKLLKDGEIEEGIPFKVSVGCKTSL